MRSHDDPVESSDRSEGGNAGGETNYAVSQISAAFKEHLFGFGGSGSPAYRQAAALGIDALNFLRGRQVLLCWSGGYLSRSVRGMSVNVTKGSAALTGGERSIRLLRHGMPEDWSARCLLYFQL